MPCHHFFEQTPEDNRLNYAENVREESKAFLSQQHHKKPAAAAPLQAVVKQP